MELKRRVIRGVAIVDASGEIDMNSSPKLRSECQKMFKQKDPKVLLNFTAVEYIDSSCIATLIECMEEMEKYKGRMAIFGTQRATRVAFEIARMDKIFKFYDTEGEALKAIGAAD